VTHFSVFRVAGECRLLAQSVVSLTASNSVALEARQTLSRTYEYTAEPPLPYL